jgi:hypothetical protein
MFSIPEKLTSRWRDGIIFLLGICFIASPWVLDYSDQTVATLNASVTGLAIALVAGSTLVAYDELEEWITAVLAAWLIVSPYILGFGAVQAASWTHFVIGVLVAVLALWSAITARVTDEAASKR